MKFIIQKTVLLEIEKQFMRVVEAYEKKRRRDGRESTIEKAPEIVRLDGIDNDEMIDDQPTNSDSIVEVT